MSQPLLEMTDPAKNLSSAWALGSAQLTVGAGEIHTPLGESDVGKLILLKALAGAQPQTRGDIWFNGGILPIKGSPAGRQNKGIITIYQGPNLLPNITVAENMFLSHESRRRNLIVNEKAVDQEAQVILDYLQLNATPTTTVVRLSVAQQQMVEIARALTLNAKLIIVDEPSTALSDSEVESLHRVVREPKGRGVSIIYVAHHLHEVFQLCDRFTVFRDGRFTGSGAVAQTTVERLTRLMVGRDVASDRHPVSEAHYEGKPVCLAVKGLSREKPSLDPHGIALHDVNFYVHAGEMLDTAELMGTGRTKVARCLFGTSDFTSDSFKLNGVPYQPCGPLFVLDQGLALVLENRKEEDMVLGLLIRNNLSLSNLSSLLHWRWFVNTREKDVLIESYCQTLQIKMVDSAQEACKLFSRSQRKVVLARCVMLNLRVLIVDEPTCDIGADTKSEVHQVLFGMAKEGVAVIAISSDLPEVMVVSDQIIALSEGRVTGEIHGDDVNKERLMTTTAINHNALNAAQRSDS